VPPKMKSIEDNCQHDSNAFLVVQSGVQRKCESVPDLCCSVGRFSLQSFFSMYPAHVLYSSLVRGYWRSGIVAAWCRKLVQPCNELGDGEHMSDPSPVSLTPALLTAAAGFGGALLAILVTPPLQHYFWRSQRQAELRVSKSGL
jgi:hypothetical protein